MKRPDLEALVESAAKAKYESGARGFSWETHAPEETRQQLRDMLRSTVVFVVAATREAVAQEIEAIRSHIPPSTDPKRRDAIVVRSTLNTAARVARGVPEDGKEQSGA